MPPKRSEQNVEGLEGLFRTDRVSPALEAAQDSPGSRRTRSGAGRAAGGESGGRGGQPAGRPAAVGVTLLPGAVALRKTSR